MAGLNSSNVRIRVTAEILTARAKDAEQKINNMDTRLREIRRIVKATGGYWIGEAGNACRQKFENQQSEIDELMKRLKGQPKTLLTIANVYVTSEEEAKSMSGPLPDDVIE